MTAFSKNRLLHRSTVRVISPTQEAANKQPSCFWHQHLCYFCTASSKWLVNRSGSSPFVLSLLRDTVHVRLLLGYKELLSSITGHWNSSNKTQHINKRSLTRVLLVRQLADSWTTREDNFLRCIFVAVKWYLSFNAWYSGITCITCNLECSKIVALSPVRCIFALHVFFDFGNTQLIESKVSLRLI